MLAILEPVLGRSQLPVGYVALSLHCRGRLPESCQQLAFLVKSYMR